MTPPGKTEALGGRAEPAKSDGLAVALCSVAKTARRRFFWAVWWTSAPEVHPFRRPDAANGGAKTIEDAVAAAERATGRAVTLVDAKWARAVNRMLRGQAPFLPHELDGARPRASKPRAPEDTSAWQVLGVARDARPEEVRAAYKRRALETHPDTGGESHAFIRVQRAYERLMSVARRPRSRRG